MEGKRKTVREEAAERQAINRIPLRTEQLDRQLVSNSRINHFIPSLEIIIASTFPCLITRTNRFDRSFCSFLTEQNRSRTTHGYRAAIAVPASRTPSASSVPRQISFDIRHLANQRSGAIFFRKLTLRHSHRSHRFPLSQFTTTFSP